MARKLRLEYAGACYHVFNRGNYRRDLFADDGAAGAFERCLGETCERFWWRVHAFTIMRNHLGGTIAGDGQGHGKRSESPWRPPAGPRQGNIGGDRESYNRCV